MKPEPALVDARRAARPASARAPARQRASCRRRRAPPRGRRARRSRRSRPAETPRRPPRPRSPARAAPCTRGRRRKPARLSERLGDVAALVAADQRDGLEGGRHGHHYIMSRAGSAQTPAEVATVLLEWVWSWTSAHRSCSRCSSSATSPTASRSARARSRGTPGSSSARRRAQRHGRPRGDGLRREPAHLGRPRAHLARLPRLRRHAAHDQAARASRARATRGQPPSRSPAARDQPRRPSCSPSSRTSPGVVMAPRRRSAGVPPHRVPVPVREARAADHRDARRRRAEPHPRHRQAFTARRADDGGELPQPALRRASSSTTSGAGSTTSSTSCARTCPA